MCNCLKEIYVAITRAKSRLFFYEEDTQLIKYVYENYFQKLNVATMDTGLTTYVDHINFCPKDVNDDSFKKLLINIGNELFLK